MGGKVGRVEVKKVEARCKSELGVRVGKRRKVPRAQYCGTCESRVTILLVCEVRAGGLYIADISPY